MRQALDLKELAEEAPTVSETIEATKAKYVKKTGIAALLSKTVNLMGDTRFSTVYLTLDSVRSVYQELRQKLEHRAEGWRIDAVCPDVLFEAQRELEGDQYSTTNLVLLWFEQLNCGKKTSDTPYQAITRGRRLHWILRKVEIKDLHRIATFLWPKYSQLRMLSASGRDDLHLGGSQTAQ